MLEVSFANEKSGIKLEVSSDETCPTGFIALSILAYWRLVLGQLNTCRRSTKLSITCSSARFFFFEDLPCNQYIY